MKNLQKSIQRGFTLAEMSIVLAIIAVLAIGGAKLAADTAKNAKATTIAAHLQTVTGGVNTYISSNFSQLVAGQPIMGFANPFAPTVNELKAAGYLGMNVQPVNIANTTWMTSIWRNPSTCTPPACDLNAIVYSNTGFVRQSDGRPDTYLAALVAGNVTTGGMGGTSLDSSPTIISSQGGALTAPNPVPAPFSTAVVAEFTGYGSQGFSQFVRNGDSRQITLNGGLVNNGTLQNNGNILSASGVNSTAVTPTGIYTSFVSTGQLAASGVTVSGTTSTGQLNVSGTTSTGLVQLNTVATAGAVCSPNGLVAKSLTGSMLSCQGGVWGAGGGATGTGLSGVFAPLKGKTISCSYYVWYADPFSGSTYPVGPGYEYAYVDSTGQIYTRITFPAVWGLPALDSGYVRGFNAGVYQTWLPANISAISSINGLDGFLCSATWPFI